jgi:hypothetical protein
MSLLGAYPLTVFVSNIFDPNTNPDVDIIVKHFHHRTYYVNDSQAGKGYKIENIDPNNPYFAKYSVPPGNKIGFPLFLADECLEITIERAPSDDYYIQVGAKAGCIGIDDLVQGGKAIFIPTDFPDKKDEDQLVYHRGGTWKLMKVEASAPPTDWTLKIVKYTFDPEEENLTIGEERPG